MRLTLHAGLEDAASALYRVDGTLEPVGEDRCRYTAHVDSYASLTTVLALTDLDFTIEAPGEFRDYLAAVASQLGRATGAPR